MPLRNKEWKAFCICDIFVIRPGKRLTKSNMQAGDKPFIGASDSNNGVTAFVKNTNASDDVKRFEIKGRPGNEYLYMFVKTVILQQKRKYAYGYKFNEERMRKQMIMLPIDENGIPDWNYMEQYAKLLFNKLKLQYLKKKEKA